MHPIEFIKNIEQTPLASVYLFTGEAEFLMEEAWSRLLERIVPVKARHFNGERLLAKEYPVQQIIAKLSTLPMFGSKLLLMVQHIEAWPKEQRSLLISYLSRPFPTSCLIMTASQKKGLEKLISAVDSAGSAVHFPALTEKEAPRWLQERARRQKKVLNLQAAAFLVNVTGLDFYRLERELEKLVAYVGERERIELEDVKQTSSFQRTFSVFELLRHVSQRKPDKAVICLRNLMLAGEAPLAILALLARQIRLIWQVKDAMGRGMTLSQVGQRLNLPPFVVKNYAEQVSDFSHEGLNGIHQSLCETDLMLKSTGTAPEMLLEALILSLCRSEQKPFRSS